MNTDLISPHTKTTTRGFNHTFLGAEFFCKATYTREIGEKEWECVDLKIISPDETDVTAEMYSISILSKLRNVSAIELFYAAADEDIKC